MPHLPRILLVADSADEREMYATTFQREGFCTLLAGTASEAYRLATELLPAAVVTDIRLSGSEDGLELTRRLRLSPAMRTTPVVMLTGCVFSHDREAAVRAGCDVFLPKPCLPDALSSVVARLLDRRGPETSAQLS